jgi:hypothetical protein
LIHDLFQQEKEWLIAVTPSAGPQKGTFVPKYGLTKDLDASKHCPPWLEDIIDCKHSSRDPSGIKYGLRDFCLLLIEAKRCLGHTDNHILTREAVLNMVMIQ